ncbi:MYB-related protein [Hordeum vulgare]|nr:MYB-related protein [Hordeum vulgare]
MTGWEASSMYHWETYSLPFSKIEGDDRAQARALSIIYSHPVIYCSVDNIPLELMPVINHVLVNSDGQMLLPGNCFADLRSEELPCSHCCIGDLDDPDTEDYRENKFVTENVEDKKNSEVCHGHLKMYTLKDIKQGTIDFHPNNILGHGGFGVVYKGILHGGTIAVVKRLKEFASSGEVQFHTEVEVMSLVVHRNLNNLIGFCSEDNERILVYPYMLNGTVASQLQDFASHLIRKNPNLLGSYSEEVANAFMPLNGLPNLAKSSERLEAAAMAVPELSLSSPAIDAPCMAAPSADRSAVTDAGAQSQQQSAQRKARRCWSPELHRRSVAALQHLGGPQVATPKQIREMMKVDGLTNDEVKSHLQKYRLHMRRASDDDQHQWPRPEQYTTSQHSSSQSGSPQGPLQLTVSSRGMSVTVGDSCDGGEENEEEDDKSASYNWEMQQNGTKASSSS